MPPSPGSGNSPAAADSPLLRAQFLTSAARLEQAPPPDRPEVAFAGRSNAGKSSALNRLCGQRGLARVSATPGRTQLLNFFDLPGGRLVDLPGYGFARAPAGARRDWGELVTDYVERREVLRGLVLVMDARHPLKDFDRQLLAWAAALHRPCHVLLTKADKLGFSASQKTLALVQRELPPLHGQAGAQLFSSTSGAGLDQARAAVLKLLA